MYPLHSDLITFRFSFKRAHLIRIIVANYLWAPCNCSQFCNLDSPSHISTLTAGLDPMAYFVLKCKGRLFSTLNYFLLLFLFLSFVATSMIPPFQSIFRCSMNTKKTLTRWSFVKLVIDLFFQNLLKMSVICYWYGCHCDQCFVGETQIVSQLSSN